MYIIPVTSNPNQTIKCSVPINGKNMILILFLFYNSESKYWCMSIKEDKTNRIFVDSLPLLTGDNPSANLLEQYDYLRIGSCTIVKTKDAETGEPNNRNFGTQFYLVWGDNNG